MGREFVADPVRSYRDLVVWQKGMALAALCNLQTRKLPRSELYGMTSQIRRASASIPANIAEGNGRETTGAYVNSLRIAQGSLKELETHVLLANMVEMMDKAAADEILGTCEQVGKLLRGLIRALQDKGSAE
jgi:four helix bundle protein